jgi:DNA polymerase-3 subunit delta
MKISPHKHLEFIKNIPKNIVSCLLYGPDNGLIYERKKYIEKYFLSKHPSLIIKIFDYDEIKANVSSVNDFFANMDLFSSQQVAIIENVAAKISNDLEKVIRSLSTGKFLIMIAAELKPAAQVRLLYETHDNFAALACYQDDEKNIKLIIANILNANKIQVQASEIELLARLVKGDRKNIINEINKVVTYYLSDNQNIDAKTLNEICSHELDSSFDDLVGALSNLNYDNAESLFDELLNQGNNLVSLIRKLSNHFMRIYKVKLSVEAGKTYQIAVKELSPPVFIMQIQQFIKLAEKLTLPQVKRVIYYLHNIELLSKSEPVISKLHLKFLFKEIIFHKE